MPPDELAAILQDFLAESPGVLVLEDGLAIFDLADAKYSVSAEREKCLLHLWSAERNLVRRVLSARQKNGSLHLEVSKFGQPKASRLELCRDRDQRSSSAKRASRAAYQRLMAAVLQRECPGHRLEKLTSATDLEHSFGPAYARGIVRQGRTAFAVIGVSDEESQPTVDAILTAGLLWLERCRENTTRYLVEGLRLFLPAGRVETVRVRLANLDHSTSRFHLYGLQKRDGSVVELDVYDAGNIATRLVRAPDLAATRERFAVAIHDVLSMCGAGASEVELAVLGPNEIAFRWRGLEFARACSVAKAGSFQHEHRITFGAGAYETVLTPESSPFLQDLLQRMMRARRPAGDRHDPLWRMQPERWLESLLMRDIQIVSPALDAQHVYRQVPAFAASDRAMIDLLTCTNDGRLAVIEVKAAEDLHLALQGLDYWARVNWHHQRGEFQRFGYFPGKELSPHPPLLFLVAPAFQVHPGTDAQLKYFSRHIDCTLVGVNEDWREGVRVIFRKSVR